MDPAGAWRPLDAWAFRCARVRRKNAGNVGGRGRMFAMPTGKGAMKGIGIMFKKDDHGELEMELHYQVRCSPHLDEI